VVSHDPGAYCPCCLSGVAHTARGGPLPGIADTAAAVSHPVLLQPDVVPSPASSQVTNRGPRRTKAAHERKDH
jgi:hypothetical protein